MFSKNEKIHKSSITILLFILHTIKMAANKKKATPKKPKAPSPEKTKHAPQKIGFYLKF